MTTSDALYEMLKESNGTFRHLRGAQKMRFLRAYAKALQFLTPGQKAALTKMRQGSR